MLRIVSDGLPWGLCLSPLLFLAVALITQFDPLSLMVGLGVWALFCAFIAKHWHREFWCSTEGKVWRIALAVTSIPVGLALFLLN